MIYFQPADTGINAILGQMMWFKRFCDGHSIAFDYIVDLDKSARNRVTNSIQALFFGDRLTGSIVDARVMPLTSFFIEVALNDKDFRGEDVIVYAGDYRNKENPGLWRFHEFQLHCLQNGFLSDTYPYWAIGLEDWTCHGSLKHREEETHSGKESCLVHMRIGDCATLLSQDVKNRLGFEIPSYALSGGRLFSEREYSLYKMGLLKDLPPRHYAERGGRIVAPETMAHSILDMKASVDECEIVLATDGYTRAAQCLSKQMIEEASDLEQRLNALLHPIVELVDRSLVGEKGALLHEVLFEIAQADTIISTSSLFPITVKCALEGESVKDRWTVVDQMDTLSRYLQEPAVVDHSMDVFLARLEQLAITEPVLSVFE